MMFKITLTVPAIPETEPVRLKVRLMVPATPRDQPGCFRLSKS